MVLRSIKRSGEDTEAELESAQEELLALQDQVNSGLIQLGEADLDGAEAQLREAEEQVSLLNEGL